MSEKKTASLLRRAARRVVIVTGTVVVIGLAGAAVMFGSDALHMRAAAVALPDAAEPTPVSVQPLMIEGGYQRIRRFVGQVEPATQINMSFELAGRMVERTVDEGDLVERGQIIARLDVDLLNAEREQLAASKAALAAQLEFAESQLQRSSKLREQGFSSVAREDEARARRDELQNRIIETDAALSAVGIRLEKSVLRAPFTGQVGQMMADPGTTLQAGEPLLSLIEKSAPQVRVGLPLTLDKDALTRAEVQIGAEVFPARLLQLRPDIDAQTRTRTALFALETEHVPAFGQTVSLVLPIDQEIRGAWVPMDALKEGENGIWTVLVVEDNVSRIAAVEVLHSEAARAFVRGSFTDGALLINQGAHRIVPGQTVRVLTTGG